MTAPTISDFLLRFPEFGEQATAVVAGALVEATNLTPSTVWGDHQTAATYYLTAHLLATRTMQIGNQVGTTSGSALGEGLQSTLYGQSYLNLRDSLPITGFAV